MAKCVYVYSPGRCVDSASIGLLEMMLIQKYVRRDQRIKSKNIFVTSKQCNNLTFVKNPLRLVQVICYSFGHITFSYDNRRTRL